MTPFTDIAHWRAHIFAHLLAIVAVLGTITAVPSIALAAREGMWAVAGMDAAALAWVLALWRHKSLSYTLRVVQFLAIIFLVGIGLMLKVGPVSQVYLLAPPVLASILLGVWPAVSALALSATAILGLSLGGYAKLYVTGMPDYALLPSLIVTINYLFIGTLITLSCGTLLQRLAKSQRDLHGFARSLELRKDELQSVNAELRLTSAAVARLNDMVLIARVVDGEGAEQPIIFANDAFQQRTGYQRGDVIGRGMRMLHGPETDPAEVARIGDAMARKQAVTAELVNYTKAGEPYWVEMEMVPFAGADGRSTHWVVVARDITERRKFANDIHRLAFYDVLTGLPNRRMLMDRLDRLLADARSGGGFGALIFIDLDHFKYINDARGHATGDALLTQAAQRLSGLMRKDDTVARLGGDEFVILLAQLGHDTGAATAAALAVGEKVRVALVADFDIDGQPYSSSASIGVTLLTHGEQSAHDLLREADTAMYRAKASGRNGVVLFEATMQAEMEQRLTLERDLGLALERGELAMHMQLQVDRDGAPVGAELLMRWQRADGSMVRPDVFIPLAESTGIIVSLGEWALRQACLGWLRLAEAGHPLPLSVNVSPTQFRQPDFVSRVAAILAETGAPANQFIFEVTEGLLVENLDETIARMHELAKLGIRFSIDDFGTGYSNLAYLKKMPLYELKIDQSFIRDMPSDANDTAIVQSILAMAGHLGLRVVAEGVETQAQAEFLSANGGAEMQGYLFARPAPLEAVIALLDGREARSA
jgi:diguanylate cyclase (GGDEF)-like protein/PAS domain S-box-containing protein